MVNTANTSWKLTTLDNTSLWTADANFVPDNINQQVSINWEKQDRPRDDQDNWMTWGLDGRSIVFQGRGNYGVNAWELSSTVNHRTLMKFWAGEDWFIYVLGQSCTISRDTSFPNLYSYNVSLVGVDPFWYHSNSASGSGTGLDFVVPEASIQYSDVYLTEGNENAWASTKGYIGCDLRNSEGNTGRSYVEPVFWCIGGTDTNVSQLIIDDQDGRKLTCNFQDNVTNGEIFAIMPWRVKSREGYMIHDACVIKLDDHTAGGDADTDSITPPSGTTDISSGTWGLDCFNHNSQKRFIDGVEPKSCILGQYDNQLKQTRNYPRGYDDHLGVFILTTTGTNTDFSVYAQWCWRNL